MRRGQRALTRTRGIQNTGISIKINEPALWRTKQYNTQHENVLFHQNNLIRSKTIGLFGSKTIGLFFVF